MVLDVFSKHGWIVPLKDKKGETVMMAFQTIFKKGRKPKYLWIDKGKEFYTKHLIDLLEKHNIQNIYILLKMKRSLLFVIDGTER